MKNCLATTRVLAMTFIFVTDVIHMPFHYFDTEVLCSGLCAAVWC